MFCLLLSLGEFSNFEELARKGQFLDAGLALRPLARQLEDPRAIREYTVLLTEYYGHQFAFRTFFLQNMLPGERLPLIRAKQRIEFSESSKIVEENLEEFLLKAKEKFPEDIQVQFALACYAYNGRCCAIQPRIEMSRREVIDIFRKAQSQGIDSASSLLALALEDGGRKDVNPTEITRRLQRAFEKHPENPDVLLALTNDMLKNRRYRASLARSRQLFELSPDPEMRVNALAAAARAYQGLGQCEEAMKAVEGGLKILPRHGFIWMLGLDCLRKGSASDYHHHIDVYLQTDAETPNSFKTYLDYLKLRGMTALDEAFLKNYGAQNPKTLLGRITQQTNLGNYHLQFGRRQQAASHFAAAMELAEGLDDPPGGLEQALQRLLREARKSP